jgi:formylglycine-generating enzyme required for sulfatase activity
MRRIVAPVEGLTLADLRSLVRWMRSKHSPLRQEWEAGVIGRADYPGVPPYRWVLQMLDGSPSNVRQIEVDEFARDDIRALFSAYRRLRRAERRLAEHNGQVWLGQTAGCHAEVR